MNLKCYGDYKIDYISRGSYGHVFKLTNNEKKTAIKLQILDSERALTILIEMAILLQIRRSNEMALKNGKDTYNPFICDIEECLLVKNANVLNKILPNYLQVKNFIFFLLSLKKLTQKDNVSMISVIETDVSDRGTLVDYFRLKNPDIMDMMFQLCFSLMQMKKKSCLIHRDIKPSNILVYRNKEKPTEIKFDGKIFMTARKYRIALVDFGLSSTFSYSRRIYYRPQCWKIGTWDWNPPIFGLYYEFDKCGIVHEIPIRSFQSDIWSIGMVALSIITCSLLKRKGDTVSYISIIEYNEDIQSCVGIIDERLKVKKDLNRNQITLLVCCCVIQKSLGNGFLPNYNHHFGTCYKILMELEKKLDRSINRTSSLIELGEKIYGIKSIDFIRSCLQWDQRKIQKYRDIINKGYFNHLCEKF